MSTRELSHPETLVVINERAGAGAMADVFRRTEHPLRDAIGDFDVAFTDYVGHATELVRDGLLNGYRRVVVGGGDGTLNEAVNGWFGADGAPIAPDARMALLTGGTGGDFRKTIGVKNRDQALAAIVGDRAVPHDVGRVR
ncbi:MAG: acylglycerol kinase family protein, partial [Myxococcales bacterium]|nr:acylglycerol kinase family protein [Myxococcales bacterium]